jgi:hypothetical protein
VNVYQNANTEAKIFGAYSSGATVEVIDKSGGQDTFDIVTDYWYKVRAEGGPEGWVFGGYLTLGEEIATQKTPKEYDARAKEISSSSMLTEKFDKNMYQPVKAFDGKPDTGWMESVSGPGLGDWVKIGFKEPVTADKLVVSPGWFDSRYWKDNNRIKRMLITLDTYTQFVDFTDTMTPQTVDFGKARTFSNATFTIAEVFATSKDDDTALAEVEFWNEGKKLEIDLSDFADKMKVVPE